MCNGFNYDILIGEVEDCLNKGGLIKSQNGLFYLLDNCGDVISNGGSLIELTNNIKYLVGLKKWDIEQK